MGLESDLSTFWNSYHPLFEATKSESPLSVVRLRELGSNVQLPIGWKPHSVAQFYQTYQRESALREEDRGDRDIELAVLRQQTAADRRVQWMDEIRAAYGVLRMGKPGYQEGLAIQYVALQLRERELAFVPRYDGLQGSIFFYPPINREWSEQGFLSDTYLDRSEVGELFGDFDEMDGHYKSVHLLERMRETRDDPLESELTPAIQLTLAQVQRRPAIAKISFEMQRIGEGELDSFFEHIGNAS